MDENVIVDSVCSLRESNEKKGWKDFRLEIKNTLMYLISQGKINTTFLKSMVEKCSVRFNLDMQSLHSF